MKLTEHELQALVAFELAADRAPQQVARKLRAKEHNLRYALRRLAEQKIATPIPFVSLYRLGFTTFDVFFSLSAQRKATRNEILRFLSETPDIVWIGEFGGEYQYGIALVARNANRLFELLHALADKFPTAFFAKELSIQRSCTVLPRRYLAPKVADTLKLSSLTVSVDDQTNGIVELDELDTQILGALAKYGSISNRDLARELQRPASTIDLRVRRLTEQQVLRGSILAIDPTRFGRQCYKLLLYAKGLNPKLSKAIHDFCLQQGTVSYIIECVGSWDYELGLEVTDPEQTSSFVHELYDRFGAVLNTVKILSKFRDPKISWFAALK